MSTRKVYTLSPLVGGKACNAACPFCVAHMTLANGIAMKAERPNLEEFRRACEYAQQHDVESLLYTSKGEPSALAGSPHRIPVGQSAIPVQVCRGADERHSHLRPQTCHG